MSGSLAQTVIDSVAIGSDEVTSVPVEDRLETLDAMTWLPGAAQFVTLAGEAKELGSGPVSQ